MLGNQLVTASTLSQGTHSTASEGTLLRKFDRVAAFDELKQKAAESGFELLETEWLGRREKHRFLHIESGKEYEWVPYLIKRGGFPKDLRTTADLLQELIDLTKGSGFELLETEWLGAIKKHRFLHIESGKEYEWKPAQIKRHGITKDLRSDTDLLKELLDLTKGSGFELLETKWLGNKTKHRFKNIALGKIHAQRPSDIKRRGFPKDLRTDADMLQELIALTKGSGFELLESGWLGGHTKHRFKHVASGKEYEWTAGHIKRRGFPKDLRTDADMLQELIALTKGSGFELIETEWLGAATKHRFTHIESGKKYKLRPAGIKSFGFPLEPGQHYLAQEVCRQVFVHIFGGQFQTDRERLKPSHGKHLELDGYEDFGDSPPAFLVQILSNQAAEDGHRLTNFQVAFEYQGHPGHRESQSVMGRDRLRVQYCKQEGVLLVVIDPPPNRINFRDSSYMYAHVCNSIREAIGQRDAEFPPGFKINLSNWNPDKVALADLREQSEENGFELLESEWLGGHTKHRFRHVASGKEYEWTASRIKHRGFPKDLRTDADMLQELIALTRGSGYKLLEIEWLGGHKKHRFLHIKSGKEYEWVPSTVKQHGFPKDPRTNADKLQELIDLTMGSGFELLETEWLGVREKHRFLHTQSGREYQWVLYQIQRHGFPKYPSLSDALVSEPSSQESQSSIELSNQTSPTPSLYDDEIEDEEENSTDSPMQMG